MEETCSCGYNLDHPKILHKSEYSKWGWFLFTILGLSAKPKLVRFICSDCNKELMVTKDPKILSKYVGR